MEYPKAKQIEPIFCCLLHPTFTLLKFVIIFFTILVHKSVLMFICYIVEPYFLFIYIFLLVSFDLFNVK